MDSLERIKFNDLTFFVREQSSDVKAVKEVVEKDSYQRRYFQIRKGETWLDLGGNIGAFAVLAASRGARVISVEPDPDSAAILRMNARVNGFAQSIEVVEAAVIPDGGPDHVTLNVNSARKNYWRNSIVKAWVGGRSISVPTICVSQLPPVENCKMDIEGAEMAILESFAAETPWNRMVFEWSFDVDASVPRYTAAVQRLERQYRNVVASRFGPDVLEYKWFPPCKTVFCY